jgi:hypothetical protein
MSKPGGCHSSGISLGDALRLPKRHLAWKRREAQSGSSMERENLAGDAQGKRHKRLLYGSRRLRANTDWRLAFLHRTPMLLEFRTFLAQTEASMRYELWAEVGDGMKG